MRPDNEEEIVIKTENAMMKNTQHIITEIFGGNVDQSEQQQDRREFEQDRMDALVDDAIDEINDHDSESVITKFASDLANIWTLYHDRDDIGERLVKEIKGLIKDEAEARARNILE